MSLSAIRVTAKSKASAAIIFLHGLGDSGNGWSFLSDYLSQSSKYDHINLVLPNAPSIPVTCNYGAKMPAWFDIFEFGNPNAKQDLKGIDNSVKALLTLVEEQIKNGIEPHRILIGGFSQGAAVSLTTAILADKKFAGFVSLSGFLPGAEERVKNIKEVNKNTPIFFGHGTHDPVIDFQIGKRTKKVFDDNSFTNVNWTEYQGMGHSTSPEELSNLFKFFDKVIPPLA